MLIAMLDVSVVTVVRYSMDRKGRERHRQKIYADTNGRMMKAAIKQLTTNLKHYVERFFLEDIIVKENGVGSGERK